MNRDRILDSHATTVDAESPGASVPTMSRRGFVRSVAIGTFACVAPTLLLPRRAAAATDAVRSLAFHHLHTNEKMSLVYFADGAYIGRSIAKLSWLLRDHRTGDAQFMDPKLLDVLHDTARAAGSRGSYEVICGYRSAKTNEMLRTCTSGVAKNSLHMDGRAIDVRLSDISTSRLRDTAKRLGRGGVGYYERSDFVHLDTGRVRSW